MTKVQVQRTSVLVREDTIQTNVKTNLCVWRRGTGRDALPSAVCRT